MKIFLNILSLFVFSFSISFAQYDYALEDLNSNSSSYQELVGPDFSPNKVTLHYFGHYNWGSCTARFGQLNDLVNQLYDQGYDQVKLVGIGKSIHSQFINNWTSENFSSVCSDDSPYNTWNDWGANQRDLFVLDHEGVLILNQNISGGLPNNLDSTIINLINEIPPDFILGDLNGDQFINVVDVVSLVNIILNDNYTIEQLFLADMNDDDMLNVIDIVQLVNIILN